MIPVMLAVPMMARLMPPCSMTVIIPRVKRPISGNWKAIDLKFPGSEKRSGFRTDIKTTTAKSIPTSAKSSRFCWRNLDIGKFSGSSDRSPFPDGEDLLLILADGDADEESQADGHSVPIRRDPHHGQSIADDGEENDAQAGTQQRS